MHSVMARFQSPVQLLCSQDSAAPTPALLQWRYVLRPLPATLQTCPACRNRFRDVPDGRGRCSAGARRLGRAAQGAFTAVQSWQGIATAGRRCNPRQKAVLVPLVVLMHTKQKAVAERLAAPGLQCVCLHSQCCLRCLRTWANHMHVPLVRHSQLHEGIPFFVRMCSFHLEHPWHTVWATFRLASYSMPGNVLVVPRGFLTPQALPEDIRSPLINHPCRKDLLEVRQGGGGGPALPFRL